MAETVEVVVGGEDAGRRRRLSCDSHAGRERADDRPRRHRRSTDGPPPHVGAAGLRAGRCRRKNWKLRGHTALLHRAASAARARRHASVPPVPPAQPVPRAPLLPLPLPLPPPRPCLAEPPEHCTCRRPPPPVLRPLPLPLPPRRRHTIFPGPAASGPAAAAAAVHGRRMPTPTPVRVRGRHPPVHPTISPAHAAPARAVSAACARLCTATLRRWPCPPSRQPVSPWSGPPPPPTQPPA